MKHDELIEFLATHYSSGGDTSPRQALGIDFATEPFKAFDTITYHTAAGGILAIDVDQQGKVLSIEII
ncbi:MAG: hypothetical protein ACYC7A_20335 [Thermoanaerobaculia bacterium]